MDFLNGKLFSVCCDRVRGPVGGELDRVCVSAGERVEERAGVGGFSAGASDQLHAVSEDFRVFLFGVFIHFGDGGTGDDVMELVDEQSLPAGVEFFLRIFCERQSGVEEFNGCEELFDLAVVFLCAGLRGECSAVHFQIELAVPARKFIAVGIETLEEVVCASEADMRHSFEVGKTLCELDMFFRGTASAVADAHEVEEFPGLDTFMITGLRMVHGLRFAEPVVGVGGREVCQNFRTVDAAPEEGMVGEAVGFVPGDFLSEEVVASRFFDDLREGGGVAENIGNPEVFHIDAEFIHEEIFPVEELADHGFAGDEVAVGFNPHSAEKFPASGCDRFFDFFVEKRIVILDELIVLRRGGAEHKIRILFDERDLAGEGACAFADGFADGPEPAGVDMRMTDGRRGERGCVCGSVENWLENFACVRGVFRIFIVCVDCAVHGVEQTAGAVILFREGFEDFKDCAEIEPEFPCFRVEERQRHCLDQPGEGSVGVLFFERGILGLAEAEERVSGKLDPEVDFSAFLYFFGQNELFFEVMRIDVASAGDRVNGTAGVVEDHGFAGEVEIEREVFALPCGGDVCADMNPCAFPFSAPDVAFMERSV